MGNRAVLVIIVLVGICIGMNQKEKIDTKTAKQLVASDTKEEVVDKLYEENLMNQ